MDDKLRKVIVTGGLGYIGAHTVVSLIEKGYTPIIVDNCSNSSSKVLQQLEKLTSTKIIYYKLDCTDEKEFTKVFINESDIYGVIHFAANKSVGESVKNPTKSFENNIGSLITLVKLMKAYNVKNIVFSSSCTVYGEPDILPVTEKSTIKRASSPYGYTKQVCEELLKNESTIGNINAINLRYFNPIGAHQSGLIGELPFGKPNNLIPFIGKVANKQLDKLVVFGDNYNTPDGTCVRDYIHVMDLAEAHVKSLEYIENKNINYDVFNIGLGKGYSVLECIKSFEKNNLLKIPYEFGDKRPGDVEKIYSDNTKAIKILKWKANRSIDQAMSDVWKWQQTFNTLNMKIND